MPVMFKKNRFRPIRMLEHFGRSFQYRVFNNQDCIDSWTQIFQHNKRQRISPKPMNGISNQPDSSQECVAKVLAHGQSAYKQARLTPFVSGNATSGWKNESGTARPESGVLNIFEKIGLKSSLVDSFCNFPIQTYLVSYVAPDL